MVFLLEMFVFFKPPRQIFNLTEVFFSQKSNNLAFVILNEIKCSEESSVLKINKILPSSE